MDKEIIIRDAKLSDAQALLDIYGPYVKNTAITFEYDVPAIDEFMRRIKNTQRFYPYLVAEVNGEILGYAYASKFHERAAYDWAIETSIYVDMNKKRMKVGEKLYTMLEKCLSEQGILNLNACIAYPEKEDNYLTKDSVKFHEKMGYKMVGKFHNCGYKFNTWYNMVWMEKIIGEHLKFQPPVVAYKGSK